MVEVALVFPLWVFGEVVAWGIIPMQAFPVLSRDSRRVPGDQSIIPIRVCRDGNHSRVAQPIRFITRR